MDEIQRYAQGQYQEWAAMGATPRQLEQERQRLQLEAEGRRAQIPINQAEQAIYTGAAAVATAAAGLGAYQGIVALNQQAPPPPVKGKEQDYGPQNLPPDWRYRTDIDVGNIVLPNVPGGAPYSSEFVEYTAPQEAEELRVLREQIKDIKEQRKMKEQQGRMVEGVRSEGFYPAQELEDIPAGPPSLPLGAGTTPFQRNRPPPYLPVGIPVSSYEEAGAMQLALEATNNYNIAAQARTEGEYMVAVRNDLYNRQRVQAYQNTQLYDDFLDRVQENRGDLAGDPIPDPSLMAIKNGGLLPILVQPITLTDSGYPENPSLRSLAVDNGSGGSLQGSLGGERSQYGYLPDYRYHHSYDNEVIRNSF